jgi:hypothetical protein
VLEEVEISVSAIAAVVGCELACGEGLIDYKILVLNLAVGDMAVVERCAVAGNMVNAAVAAADAYEVDLSLEELGWVSTLVIHIQTGGSWWESQDVCLCYEVSYPVGQMGCRLWK